MKPHTTCRQPLLAVLLSALVLLAAACDRPRVPATYAERDALPRIYPDYAEVTIPVNMAPLCFELLTGADEAVTRITGGGRTLLCGGLKARPDARQWRELTAVSAGGSMRVEVFARQGGQWERLRPFRIYVSADSIDPWLSYRMISPSYVSYEELTLCQRHLESFDERVFADNMLCSTESGGQCINCHSYQQWQPGRMQLHARERHGGTLVVCDGSVEKVDLRHDSLRSAAVYPAWHPWLPLIAYSTNRTVQAFHTGHPNKIEVIDTESGLVLYDVEHHELSTIADEADELETFPCWSADGRTLYYSSAHFRYEADSASTEEIILRATEVKYNLYSRSFDPATRQFGQRRLVFAADTLPTGDTDAEGRPLRGLSATMPRVSPDGRWLLFTVARWGNFHIWHHDAELWLMDLTTGSARPLDELNSPDTESYHAWSSNGRWVVFSSRRYDGVFTRPFFAHIGADGRAAKPFELPMADPDCHRQLLKSYNVPELTRAPVALTPQQVATALKGRATPAGYRARGE